MRDNIIFYRSFAEAAKNIPDEDRLAFYDALFDYAFEDEDPEDIEGIAKALFTIAKANIDANNRKAESGKKGGRPKDKPMVSDNETNGYENEKPMVSEEKTNGFENKNQWLSKTESTDNRIQSTDNRIQSTEKEEKVQKKKTVRFSKPSLDEVKSFIAEKKLSVSAERFYDYYESNGWKVGKNPMKDWKATLRNWSRNGGGKSDPGHVVIKPPDYIRTAAEMEFSEEDLPF